MKKSSKIFLLGVIIAGASGAVFWQAREASSPSAFPSPNRQTATPETFGEAQAKVVVTAFIPVQAESSQRLVRVLRTLVREEAKRVRVSIYHSGQPGVQVTMRERGLKGPTILINGRSEWSWKENGRERKVKLWGGAGISFQPADVIKAVDIEWVRVYGQGLSPAQRRTLLNLAQSGKTKPSEEALPPGQRELAKVPVKLQVEAFLPPTDSPAYQFLRPTLQTVEKWAQEFPQNIHVQYHHRSEEGVQKSLQMRGLTDVCLLINGRSSHLLKQGKAKKRVVLEKVNGQPTLTYQVEDLEALFQQYLGGGENPLGGPKGGEKGSARD